MTATAEPRYVPTPAGVLAEAYTTLVAELEALHTAVDDGLFAHCLHCATVVNTRDPRDRCATIRLVHGRP